MSGGAFLIPRMTEALAIQGGAIKTDIWRILNEREREILKLLGDGLQPREISSQTGVSYKTVVNACSIIKNKLGLRTTNELSQKAYEYKNMI